MSRLSNLAYLKLLEQHKEPTITITDCEFSENDSPVEKSICQIINSLLNNQTQSQEYRKAYEILKAQERSQDQHQVSIEEEV